MTRRPPRSTLFPYPTLFRSHWFEFDPPVLAHPGRDVLQTLERLQGEGDETPSRPPRIRRPPTARRYAELGFDVRKKLHRAEIAARRGNFTPPLGPEPLSDPIHVELSLHRLLLGEVPDGEVLVADHQAVLALASVATHPPAKVSELGKIPGVFDVGRCRIAMHDGSSFISAPPRSSSR